jgi:hypothetical protein
MKDFINSQVGGVVNILSFADVIISITIFKQEKENSAGCCIQKYLTHNGDA